MQYNITYREKDGGWQYIISYKDTNGKWKQKSKQGFEKSRKGKQLAKEAAEKALQELKDKLENQNNLLEDYRDITFLEYVNKFIKHEKLYKEGSTIVNYKTALNKFSKLHNLILSEIKNHQIQDCIDDLIREGLNYRSIHTYFIRIQFFFNKAVESNYILQSPITKIKIPKEKKQTEKRALNQNELNDLLNKLTNKNYYIMSLLAGTCGLRLGEILGLNWNDVDFKYFTITINKQLKLSKSGIIDIGDVKSENSNRVIPISKNIAEILSKFKSDHLLRYDGRIFSYSNPRSMSSNIKRAYKAIGYDISIHELRHTYATLLISNGVDFKTAAQILGHDVKLTMGTYSHVTDEMLNKASEKIQNIFNF